jgi:uncharacterized iron-regulated membrane protein
MTRKRTLSMLYTLHSWAGIVVGLWVFVVGITGALLVFKDELDLWANPSLSGLQRAAEPAGPDAVIESLSQKNPGAVPRFLRPPSPAQPVWFVSTGGDGVEREKHAARADSGEVIGAVDSELGQFVRNIHVFLIFGPRWPVGFLGVVVLFLIASGFVIHRKVVAELFTLRWRRSLRVVTADVHRMLGIWGLGFHVVIAFTGAWLGLAPVFERSFAHLAGEPERTAPNAAAQRAGTPNGTAQPSLDRLLARAASDIPGLHPTAILLTRWGEPGARVRFTGHVEGSLSTNLSVTYDVATGVLLERQGPAEASLLRRVDRLMEPLHFGNFSGAVLKWLYFVLGLGQAALALSGTLVWIERSRLRARDASPALAERSASHV